MPRDGSLSAGSTETGGAATLVSGRSAEVKVNCGECCGETAGVCKGG